MAATLMLPTCRHARPSVETEPTTVVPMRDIFNHAGNVTVVPARYVVAAPVAVRVMNSTFPDGSTSRMTCAAAAAVDSRSMTPALADALVFCIDVTCATTCVSLATGCDTNSNASVEPQMSAPPPTTVNALFAKAAIPAGTKLPMF